MHNPETGGNQAQPAMQLIDQTAMSGADSRSIARTSTRRRWLQRSAAAVGGVMLSACYEDGAHVTNLAQGLGYLKNPALRAKEIGDAPLVVANSVFSGQEFQDVEWRNIRFVNCQFRGAYHIKLARMENCVLENCRFAGIFGWGVQNQVKFISCTIVDGSHLWGAENSVDVVYERCRLKGTSDDINRWGSVGSYGDAAFIQCTGQRMSILGHAKLTLRECEFENIGCAIDGKETPGLVPDLLIEKCKLVGLFDAVPSSFQSLTIRDSSIGTLDLTGVTIKGDVLLERVKGTRIIGAVEAAGANSLTLRDSEITGDAEGVCNFYAGAFKRVLVENVNFGSVEGEPVGIGGGYEIDDIGPQPQLTQSVVFKNVKTHSLRSAGLSAGLLRLENVEVDEANFCEGLSDSLEFNKLRVAKHIDLSKTRVKQFKQTGGTDLRQLGSGLKLEGSNIKLPG